MLKKSMVCPSCGSTSVWIDCFGTRITSCTQCGYLNPEWLTELTTDIDDQHVLQGQSFPTETDGGTTGKNETWKWEVQNNELLISLSCITLHLNKGEIDALIDDLKEVRNYLV